MKNNGKEAKSHLSAISNYTLITYDKFTLIYKSDRNKSERERNRNENRHITLHDALILFKL